MSQSATICNNFEPNNVSCYCLDFEKISFILGQAATTYYVVVSVLTLANYANVMF